MKKKMFALAFGLLLTFGLQGQFAQIDPVETLPGDGDSPVKCRCQTRSCPNGNMRFECIIVGDGDYCYPCFDITGTCQ
jgi:hypothetical protein